MTRLQRAIYVFDRRSQFNDRPKLEEIIAAVREEEQAKFKKFKALCKAAKEIIESSSLV